MDVNFTINRKGHEEKILEEALSFSYSSESTSDLVFICQNGARRHTNQSILLKVSPLIAMLQKPQDKLWITLQDTDVYTLDCLLRFLYTGEVVISDSSNIELLSDLCASLMILLDQIVRIPVPPAPLYCICRQPEKGRMIGCDFCDEWYHPICINIAKSEINILKEQRWKCPRCSSSSERVRCQPSSTVISEVEDFTPSTDPSSPIPSFSNAQFSESEEERSSPKPLSRKRKRPKAPQIRHETPMEHEIEENSKHESASQSNQGSPEEKKPSVIFSTPVSLIEDISESPPSREFQVKIEPNDHYLQSPPPTDGRKHPSNHDVAHPRPKIGPKSKMSPSKEKRGLFLCKTCLAIFVSRKALQEHELDKHP
eukprot:TRINITY_DN7351_c0_g1_i1.p1 TRINITY_DN7351_c0_g1~~TRINITY_DN7351_c0_g1_i1.p1  ORF type:complete len:369 (-),score=55.77 TRINITY_DN7351_c0_g1_i1:200-1306(-)